MWLTLLLFVARAAGALFIFSGVGKLMGRRAFMTSLRALPFVPPWGVALVAAGLPWVEIVLGSALLMGFFALYAAWLSLALLLAFSLVAISAVARGMDVPCSCFGKASQAPISMRTVVRNAFFALLLLPLVLANRPAPVSMDALLNEAIPRSRSLADTVLLLGVPLCVAGIAAIVAVAQRTLKGLSVR